MPQQTLLPGFDPEPIPTDELFFALLPDAALTQQFDQRLEDVCARTGLRGERVKQFHMTLQAIEAQAGLRAEYVEAARRAAASINFLPFEVHLDSALSFQRGADNRPVVLSNNHHPEKLMGFQKALTNALLLEKLPLIIRSFTPHVTLFYGPGATDRLSVEPVCWTVREFVLIHGQIKKPYVVLGRWQLNGQ